MSSRRVVVALGVFWAWSALSVVHAADNLREHLLLDAHWRFHLGDSSEVGNALDYPEPSDLAKVRKADLANWAKMESEQADAVAAHSGEHLDYVQPAFDASSWRELNLPHDWAVELPFSESANFQHGFKDLDPKKGTTIGWYRRNFSLPASDKGRTLTLDFDGVYRNSLVWLNGRCLGRHPSGYSSFQYDITKYANCGDGEAGNNTLVVRLDATRFEGWFYEGAGIYRHVWLNKTEPVHVAHWGTYVTTAPADSESQGAVVTARVDIENDANDARRISVGSKIQDADGKTVASSAANESESSNSIAGGSHKTFTQQFNIAGAHLWSPQTPYLYTLVTTVKGDDGATLDRYETPFGVRTVRFDPDKGFFLNGKRYEILGTCNHQDHAGVGSAIPDALQYWRIAKLKEMGANAYRTSHNPPTPELLDACDKLGMLVLDETRRAGADREALGQLQSMIERDKNHPCVFAWSICNEEMRDNVQGDNEVGAPIAKAMQDLAHGLDPSRLCTCAMNSGYGSGFATVIDIMGFNYPTRGKRPITCEDAHAKFPEKPCMGTEDASTRCSRGIYSEDDEGNISSHSLAKGTITDPKLKAAGYVSAYDIEGTCTAEKWWNFYYDRPFMSGSFVWTGFDYRGEPTPYKWPCTTSHFGIMDLCGFPKDNYWYYQAWWTDKPVLHVYPHWNWTGKEGKTVDVWVQSNCDEVELSLNGEVIGRQKVEPRKHLEWTVTYAPGTLLARGFKHSVQTIEDKVETTGAASQLRLAADRTQINGNGEDVAVVTVDVSDEQGRKVPTADNMVTFAINGPAKIIGVGNGNPSSHEADKTSERLLFNGLAQVIVQSDVGAGEVHLTAKGKGLKPAVLMLNVTATAPRPAVP
ncbi:MAG TPA: beta-galactosidase GalA [Pirellulales bacterium]|nr:beta-galactosidase GalA [Pirellulales bacterium]